MNTTRWSRLISTRLIPLSIIAATTVLMTAACSSDHNRESLPTATSLPYPVRVIKPSTEATSGETKVTSTLRSRNEATISAKTTGQIVKLDVRVGDRVKSGQLLVRIDSSMAAIQLQNAKASEKLAQANRANAKAEFERAKTLQEQGALSDANYERVQMAFDIASAQTDQARAAIRASGQQISDASILAPFAGVVSARFRNLGDTVSGTPPTALLSLVDPDHLEVRMAVPEALAPKLTIGDSLTAVESPSGTTFQVRVSAMGATVDSISRTVEVLADVESPTTQLKPGALVTVDLAKSSGMQGLYIPSAAWQKSGTDSYVRVVVGDQLLRKDVVASVVTPGTVFVTSGLTVNDDVALDAEGIPEGHSIRAISD